MSNRFISKKERQRMTGVSECTWWRMVKRGEAPPPRQISPGRVGDLESVILEWMENRPVTELDALAQKLGVPIQSELFGGGTK